MILQQSSHNDSQIQRNDSQELSEWVLVLTMFNKEAYIPRIYISSIVKSRLNLFPGNNQF